MSNHEEKAYKHINEILAKARQCQMDGIKLVVQMPDGTEKQIAPLCDCLIDQGFIDDTPVGHACNKLSKYHDHGINVCEDCIKMLGDPEQMHRVTIPKILLAEAAERMMKEHNHDQI